MWIPGVPAARAAPPAMSSNQKRFAPHVIAVTQGTVVSFPNQDKVFHNVFSRTTGSEFDLGLYRNGASRSVRFSKPGLVRVYCNIHPDMAGYVRVLEDGVFTTTDDKGAFRLAGIPPGRRVVQVWDERGGEKQFPLELEAGPDPDAERRARRHRLPAPAAQEQVRAGLSARHERCRSLLSPRPRDPHA